MTARLAEWALAATLFAAGVIHLMPGIGVLSASRLQMLYGVSVHDPTLILLLRHRAILFAILGSLFVVAALFQPTWRVPASVAALVCMASFILLAGDASSAAIQRVAQVDIAVGGALAAALAWRLLLR
jgi:hypothetical protein